MQNKPINLWSNPAHLYFILMLASNSNSAWVMQVFRLTVIQRKENEKEKEKKKQEKEKGKNEKKKEKEKRKKIF